MYFSFTFEYFLRSYSSIHLASPFWNLTFFYIMFLCHVIMINKSAYDHSRHREAIPPFFFKCHTHCEHCENMKLNRIIGKAFLTFETPGIQGVAWITWSPRHRSTSDIVGAGAWWAVGICGEVVVDYVRKRLLSHGDRRSLRGSGRRSGDLG